MELAHRWNDRNLTKIELIVAVLILALLIGSFSRYGLNIFSEAEKNMVNSTVININTALNYRAAFIFMQGDVEELKRFENINPMGEIQAVIDVNNVVNEAGSISMAMLGASISIPSNYAGVISAVDTELMEKGKWYFQQEDHVLVYRLSNSEFFSSELDGPARIRFRTKIEYVDKNANGNFDPIIDEYKSVKLKSLDMNNWI